MPGQMLHGQLSLGYLLCDRYGLKNLPLKFMEAGVSKTTFPDTLRTFNLLSMEWISCILIDMFMGYVSLEICSTGCSFFKYRVLYDTIWNLKHPSPGNFLVIVENRHIMSPLMKFNIDILFKTKLLSKFNLDFLL